MARHAKKINKEIPNDTHKIIDLDRLGRFLTDLKAKMTTTASAGLIPKYKTGGRLSANTAVDDDDAVNKEQMDEELDEKLDKQTGNSQVYVNDSSGNPGKIAFAETATANSFPKRNTNSQFSVGTPTDNSHVATKKYVDDAVIAPGFVTKTYVDEQDAATLQSAKDYTDEELEDYATKEYVDEADATKLDKQTGNKKVYVNNSSGSPSVMDYSDTASPATFALRGLSGKLSVGTPTDNDHAATKKYVDDADADILTDAKDYADEKDSDTLEDAKDYTDEQIEQVKHYSYIPVGGIYMSINSTSPASPSVLGYGEWEQIIGVPRCTNNESEIGQNIGSDTHVHGSANAFHASLRAYIGSANDDIGRIAFLATGGGIGAEGTYGVNGNPTRYPGTQNHSTAICGYTDNGSSIQNSYGIYGWIRRN